MHCLVHHPVVQADILLDLLDLVPLQLLLAQFIRAGRWWAEVVVQRLASPGGLDQQDRGVEFLGQRESKTEFRSDLVGPATEADGEWSGAAVAVGDRRDVNPLGDREGLLDLLGLGVELGCECLDFRPGRCDFVLAGDFLLTEFLVQIIPLDHRGDLVIDHCPGHGHSILEGQF